MRHQFIFDVFTHPRAELLVRLLVVRRVIAGVPWRFGERCGRTERCGSGHFENRSRRKTGQVFGELEMLCGITDKITGSSLSSKKNPELRKTERRGEMRNSPYLHLFTTYNRGKKTQAEDLLHRTPGSSTEIRQERCLRGKLSSVGLVSVSRW